MPQARPFTTFNFRVNLTLAGAQKPLCEANFAECDGLEMSISPKTIREGGNNGRMIHLPGSVSYGQLTLKRGMSSDAGLWEWFERSQTEFSLRASGLVVLLQSNRKSEQTRFELSGCLPVKIKAPGLNAKDGLIAIEEMQIAYETLSRKASRQEGG